MCCASLYIVSQVFLFINRQVLFFLLLRNTVMHLHRSKHTAKNNLIQAQPVAPTRKGFSIFMVSLKQSKKNLYLFTRILEVEIPLQARSWFIFSSHCVVFPLILAKERLPSTLATLQTILRRIQFWRGESVVFYLGVGLRCRVTSVAPPFLLLRQLRVPVTGASKDYKRPAGPCPQ